MKSDCKVVLVTLAGAYTKGAEDGTASFWVQLGPCEPMNDVLPTSTLFSTVKFDAELTAIPKPNAPDKLLFMTVPDELTLLLKKPPNHVRGPTAMPILPSSNQ
jgi:hypothetical protein